MPMNAKIQEKGCLVGELKVLQRLNKYEFGVELWLMRGDENRNHWSYQNLDKFYSTFVGKPILIAYVGNKIGDGHNMTEKTDAKTGEKYYSFTEATAERIVGTLSDDINDFSLVERDGHKWLKAKGRLFEFYAREAVQEVRRTGRMDVSVETEIFKSHKDGDVDVFTEWAGLGVTILGEGVAPAIPGASIAKLAAMMTEFNDVKLKAASYRANEAKEKNKPTENPKSKKIGVNKVKMNKVILARLASLFEGYTVIGCNAEGTDVALVDKAGLAYRYTFMAEDNGEVVKSRIKPVAMSAFVGNGEDAMDVDMDKVIETAVNNAATDANTIKTLSEELETAKATIAALEKREHGRRIADVKTALSSALAEVNAFAKNGNAGLADAAKELETKAETYACMEDNGAFCGAEKIRKDLMAAKAELDIKTAAEEKSRNAEHYAWMGLENNKELASGIDAALAYIVG